MKMAGFLFACLVLRNKSFVKSSCVQRLDNSHCFVQVRDAAKAIDPHLVAVACGSFRRGKATCGDVDVLISHPDGKSHKGVFNKVLLSLHDSGKLRFIEVFGIFSSFSSVFPSEKVKNMFTSQGF